MKGRRDLVWVGHNSISHRLREYERWVDKVTRSGTTMCGIGLNLTYHNLRKGDPTYMACVAASVITR